MSCKYSKAAMRLNMLLLLWDEKLSIVIQQSVQALQNLSFGKIEFIQDKPVPFSNCLDEWPFPKNEFSCLIGEIVADVFLYLSVFMIVYSNAFVAECVCNVPNHGGFAC